MKVLLVLLISGSALAGQENTQQVQTGSTSNAIAIGGSGGASSMRYEGGYSIASAPPVSAPALTTSFSDTCMGSTSVGASGMGGGLTIGTTWTDEDCQNRLNARMLQQLGQPLAAKEVLCNNKSVYEAYERLARATGNPSIACLSEHPDAGTIQVRYSIPKPKQQAKSIEQPKEYNSIDKLEYRLRNMK
jgi:hypothetical protein